MIEMTTYAPVEEVKEDKEVITSLVSDITPTEGIQLLRERANGIQNYCSDVLIPEASLDNVAVYCGRNSASLRYFDIPTLNSYTKQLTPYSFGQLCNKIGVPSSYMLKCMKNDFEVMAQTNINTWLDAYNKDLFVRLYEDKVRAVLSSKYSTFDTPDVVDVLDEATRGLDLRVKGYFMNEERFHARLIQSDKMNINGEDLFAGIQIDSSDVGRSALTVNFFIFKQICTNGLCISRGKANLFTQKHIGIATDDFREELKQSLKYLPQLIEEYSHIIQRCAMQYSILGSRYTTGKADVDKQLQELIAKLKAKTKLSDDSLNKVIQLSNDRYGFSDWGIVNSITEVAQDFTLERRIELEKIAGGMLRVV